MSDINIIKTVWDGKLPLRFILKEQKSYSFEKATPIYMLVPRVSYFPIFYEKLRNHFKKFVESIDDAKIWFSVENVPLKSHYPVGLLYDLSTSNRTLPWSVSVHFTNFPSDKLIDVSKDEYMISHFIYTVKEADYLKSRGVICQSFQHKEMETMWNGLQSDNFDIFWSVNRKLNDVEKIINETNKACGENQMISYNGFRSIPCRIYRRDKVGFMQKIVKSVFENGDLQTLSDLIPLLEEPHNEEVGYKFITHGIEVPSQTPLQWLSEHFSYADNFLHILIVDVSDCGSAI